MTDNNTRIICTTAIWITTAIIFTFGVFRFNWTGDFAGILWALVALALAYAPLQATRAIWESPSSERNSEPPPNEPPKV